VKKYRGNDGHFNRGGESEDSDYKGGPEQPGHPAAETEANNKKESEQEGFPILSVGSFAGYV